MLIDTHAHLAHPLLLPSIDTIIKDSAAEGIGKIISIGCSLQEIEANLNFVGYDSVKITAGLYPRDDVNLTESKTPWQERLIQVKKLIQQHREHIVAIGECGLDFSTLPEHEIQRDETEQIDLFRSQIELARKLDLPVVIHSRNATSQTLEVLSSEQKSKPIRAVWHCFNEGYDIASKLLDIGIKLSINGIFTYKSAQNLRDCIKKIPLDAFMLETDAPYLLPLSLRKSGEKVNRPQYVRIISNAIAEELRVEPEIIDKNTTNTAVSFFNL